MLADEVDYVIGVDTHRDEHVLAVVVASTGAVVAQRSVRSDGARLCARRLRSRRARARRACLGGRGRRSLRRRLARYLSGRGETVLEAGRSPRNERRLQGKDDPLDATRAARTALASETLALPRDGATAGGSAAAAARAPQRRRCSPDALVQLRSVIVTAPDELRDELRRLPAGAAARRCSRFRRSSSRTPDELATMLVLRTLARRIQAATPEADELERRSSPTSARSHHSCSTSQASARSSPRS